MNFRTLNYFYSILILFATLLVSCGGVTPIPVSKPIKTPTVFSLETNTPMVGVNNLTESIEPENVNKLEIVDKWGTGNVYGIALSPDETNIATSTATGVYIYDYETLQQKQFIDLPITLSTKWSYSPSKAISFSPDDNSLALGYDGITIWSLLENRIVRRISNEIADFNIVQVEFSPKGDTIAVMSMGGYAPCDAWGGNFALYNVGSGDMLYSDFFCPESALFHFSFLNNGNIAFVATSRGSSSQSYKASIVNATTGVLVKKLSYEGYIDSISQDGSKVAVRNSKDTEIINTNTQKTIGSIDGIVIFLPNNQNQLVDRDSNWTITTNNNKLVCNFESSPLLFFDVYRSTFTLAGDKLIYWDRWNQNLEIWDMSQCKLAKQLFIPIGEDSLEYSGNGNLLATSSLSNVYILNGTNGDYKFPISGNFNSQPTQYYDFRKDSKTMVVVSDVKPYTISFWDLVSGKEAFSIPTNFEYIRYVSFSSDGTVVITADNKGIHLWNAKNSALLTTIPGRFRNIYFSPKNNYFALIDDGSIVFRNAKNGELEKKITVPKENFDVVFSKDWTYMAIIEKEQVELWDMKGEKIREYMEYTPIDSTVKSRVTYDIKFSPNNNLLVAVRYDYENYSIRFWETQTGAILRDVFVPFAISKMDFSPDGKKLTVLGNGIIYVFGIKTSP
jgi:hypothetical protein